MRRWIPAEAFVGGSSDGDGPDVGRTGAQALGKDDARVELVRSACGRHVPFVGALQCWVTPGSGVELPLSIGRPMLEEQPGVVVKAREARAVRTRTRRGVHARREIQHALKQREVEVGHRAGERNFKQGGRTACFEHWRRWRIGDCRAHRHDAGTIHPTTAAYCAAAAAITSTWKISWKPKVRGHGFGRWLA